MTTEDLILGHFDGTLTSEQEAQLQAELHVSPEIRSLYEQHRSLHSILSADAASLAPSSRLDKAVVAAALGAAPEVIGGGGALSWLTAKMAVGISAVLAGGISIAIIAGSGSEEKPAPATVPNPVVRTAPAVIEESKSEQVEVKESGVQESGVGESERREVKASGGEGTREKSAASAKSGTERGGEVKTTVKPARKLKLPKEDPTVIEGETRTQPDGK